MCLLTASLPWDRDRLLEASSSVQREALRPYMNAFAAADRDGDGQLSMQETARLLTAAFRDTTNTRVSPKFARQLLTAMDIHPQLQQQQEQKQQEQQQQDVPAVADRLHEQRKMTPLKAPESDSEDDFPQPKAQGGTRMRRLSASTDSKNNNNIISQGPPQETRSRSAEVLPIGKLQSHKRHLKLHLFVPGMIKYR